MPDPTTSRATTSFRASVVLGCTALLIGAAGILHFGERDRRRQARHPTEVATVQIGGLHDPAGVDVVVRWQDPDGVAREEGGEVGDDPWTWAFVQAPEATPLVLIVYRQVDGKRRERARQHAILTRGATFEAFVRPARRPDGR